MTLILDLSKEEELRLERLAKQRGVAPAEAARQLVIDHLPTPSNDREQVVSKNAAAIAYLQGRMKRESTTDLEETRKAEEELAEFERNLNANRKATGERLLFPE